MPKNLDGIKKLSGEELRKSRKMVLDYIGEEDKSEKPKKDKEKARNIPKIMDGIMVSKKKSAPILSKEEKKKKFVNRDYLNTLSAQGEDIKNKPRKENDKIPAVTKVEKEKKKFEFRKEEDRKRKEAEEAKQKADEKKRVKKEELERQKEHDKEIAKKKVIEKEKRKKQKKKIAKEKKEEDRKKKLKLISAKKKKKRKKRKEKKENIIIKKYKDIINYFKKSFKKLTFKKISKFLLNLIIIFTVIILFGYILFSFILLRVNFNNEVISKIAVRVPVPALVFNKSIISYNKYNELYKDKNKDLIGESLILKKLANKYDFDLINGEQALNREILEEKLIKDKDINKVSFMLLHDIKEAIEDGMKFSDAKERYRNNKIQVDQSILEKIKDDVKDLKVKEISSEITKNGIYIIQNRVNNFDYIRIDNINLDEYLTQEIRKLKYWILVK